MLLVKRMSDVKGPKKGKSRVYLRSGKKPVRLEQRNQRDSETRLGKAKVHKILEIAIVLC